MVFRRSLLVVLGLVLVSCGGRCGGESSATRPAATIPAETVALVAVDDSKAFLDSMRAQFRDTSNAMPLPANVADHLASIAALPEQVARHVPERSPFRMIYVVESGAIRRVAAVRPRLEANEEHPFGVEVPLFAGGPDGSRYVVGRPQGSDAAVALYDDVLVVAETSGALRLAGRYVAEVALGERAGEGLSIRIRGSAFDGPLRTLGDESVEELTSGWIASARAERARHPNPPFFGEPEQLATAIRDRLRRVLAYLPDLGDGELRVVASASGVRITGRADVEPNSPLARLLAGAGVGPTWGLASLPETTALAIASHRGRDETPWVDLLAPIAGDRLDVAGRERLVARASRIDATRGDSSLFALGSHVDGPFALFAFPPKSGETEAVDYGSILSVPYLGALVSGMMGCEELAAPAEATTRRELCRDPQGVVELEVRSGESSRAIVLSSRPPTASGAHGAATGVVAAPNRAPTADGLFSEPDAERALALLGESTIATVAFSARGFVPALAFFRGTPLARLGSSRSLPTSAAPIVFALRREPDGDLGTVLVATPRSVEETWGLVSLAMMLAGGG